MRALGITLTLVVSLVLLAAPAYAASFSNTALITINDNGPASPYPSPLTVSGLTGPITDVNVTLNNIGHAWPDDLDIVVQSPYGTNVMLMSDACGSSPVEDFDWIFDDEAASTMADSGPCTGFFYKPTNFNSGTDGLTGLSNLSTFDEEDPNGTWYLYVLDDLGGQTGDIELGWSLNITVGSAVAQIPALGTFSGIASPYPLTQSISGRLGTIWDVNVTLDRITHSYPDDLDILVQSPAGDAVVLISDACGDNNLLSYFWRFDDEAGTPLTDETVSGCTPFNVRPTNFGLGDVFPAPAPAGSFGSSLAAFDGENPNGTWRLFIVDDVGGDRGFLTSSWSVDLVTAPPPDTNLLFNGDFSAPVTDFFLPIDATVNNAGGQLNLALAPGATSANLIQFVQQPASSGLGYELTFQMSNPGSTVKTANVIVRDLDWNPINNCLFALQAFSPTQFYTMRFTPAASYGPMVFQLVMSGTDTQPIRVDNLNLQFKPSLSVTPPGSCVAAPPPNTNLIYNGAFDAGLDGFANWNTAMQVVNIGFANGNVMELARWQGTPNGGFYQFLPYVAPANGVLEFTFQLQNLRPVNRVINIIIRNADWSNTRSCFLNLPANSPLQSYTMRAKATADWQNIVLQGWAQNGDYAGTPPLHFRFDNLNLQYKPGLTLATPQECPTVVLDETASAVGGPAAPVAGVTLPNGDVSVVVPVDPAQMSEGGIAAAPVATSAPVEAAPPVEEVKPGE